MLKLVRAAIALIVALGLAGFVAEAATAYPAPVFSLKVSSHTVVGGKPVTASASASVTCDSWTLRFGRQTAVVRHAKRASHVFPTSKVHKRTTEHVTAVCVYGTSGSGSAAGSRSPVLTQTVFLTPAREGAGTGAGTGNGSGAAAGSSSNNGAGGLLPNTGGPGFWALLLAIVLLIGGLSTMSRNRRRRTIAESANK